MLDGKVVIVDGYSTGSFLAPKFNDMKMECIHVQSEDPINPFDISSFREGSYSKNIVHRSIASTVAQLAQENVVAIVAGSESGVILSDQLSHSLGLPGNDPQLTLARRDKQKMQLALQAAGISGPTSIEVSSYSEFLTCFPRINVRKYVVKPKDAAGSDGVHICSKLHEVEKAIEQLIGQVNSMNSLNETVLVQEFLEGPQYIINTVSAGGRHLVSEIWSDNRQEVAHGVAYSFEQLLALEGEVQSLLSNYVLSVLDALGVAEGAAHSEVIITEEGPKLIEVGCRTQGSIDPDLIESAIGYSHVSLSVDAVCAPEKFSKPIHFKDGFSSVRCVSLISHKKGRVVGLKNIDKIRTLPSFSKIHSLSNVGDSVEVTVDISTSPGVFYLTHPSVEQLEADYQSIRTIEEGDGFFILENAQPAEGVN